MEVHFKLLSPLSHSAFTPAQTGNIQMLRRVPVWTGKGVVQVPAVSGNALRAKVRRILFREMFTWLGMRGHKNFATAYSYAANGGYIDGHDATVDPAKLEAVREACPPLSVLGAAIGKYMLPGRVRFGILWPLCDVTVSAGVCSNPDGDKLPSIDAIEGEMYHSRLPDREFAGVNEKARPMPHGFETLNTGIQLRTRIDFLQEATEIEAAAIFWGLSQVAELGGKVAAGMGKIKRTHPAELDSQAYQSWLTNLTDGGKAAIERILCDG